MLEERNGFALAFTFGAGELLEIVTTDESIYF